VKKIIVFLLLLVSLNIFASNKKVLVIVAPENFYTDEFFYPEIELGRAGIGFDIASTKTGFINGVYFDSTKVINNDSTTGYVSVKNAIYTELTLDKVVIKNYAAVIIIGGSGTITHLWQNEELKKIIQDFKKANKYICGICAGSVVLAKSGVLKGITATTYPDVNLSKELENNGAIYIDEKVIIDKKHKIITSNGPMGAQDFGKAIVDCLK